MSVAEQTEHPSGLRRELRFWDAIALSIAIMSGRSPSPLRPG